MEPLGWGEGGERVSTAWDGDMKFHVKGRKKEMKGQERSKRGRAYKTPPSAKERREVCQGKGEGRY